MGSSGQSGQGVTTGAPAMLLFESGEKRKKGTWVGE